MRLGKKKDETWQNEGWDFFQVLFMFQTLIVTYN